ncbi:hypothetical protein ONE63_001397 [Megalurothrips usitatus]|uniref:Uncharacterized protein n=1 Tax=Megalurothrips usitatus TaxID=439358 RepID=A0AAV7XBY5_9NEOP|nr:hypothetical protein ONE63_001397 [Megalurothrips usitatus]
MAWTATASVVVMVACAVVGGAGVAAAPGKTYVRIRHLYSEIPHHHHHGPPADSHQHHHHHHHHHHYHHGDDGGEVGPYPPSGPAAAGPPSEMLPPAVHASRPDVGHLRPRHPALPPAGEVAVDDAAVGRFTEPGNGLAEDDYHPRPAADEYVPIDYPPGNAGSLPLDDYLPDAPPRPNDAPPEMRPPPPPPQQPPQQQKPHLAHLIPLPQQQQQLQQLQLQSPPRMHRPQQRR